MPQVERKARIVVADDHVRVLDSVSTLLRNDFTVVASAPDGPRALEAAQRLDPDLVLLDITMPGLSGLQVARELKRSGARARIVFLSMHPAQDYIEAAVSAGGHGYVLKTRIQPDLVSAVNHVLSGQIFVPTLSAMSVATSGARGHAVYFYRDESAFLEEAAGLARTMLRRGEPFVIIGNEAMRNGVAELVQARGVDLALAGERNQYRSVSTVTFLSQSTRNGWPDAAAIIETASELEQFRLSSPDGPRARVTILGNMTPVWRGQSPNAAFELERLWDTLTAGAPFFTVCAYAADCFSALGSPSPRATVCAEHGFVGYA
jgi:DNA-binding NarL/FixJ family response regulator